MHARRAHTLTHTRTHTYIYSDIKYIVNMHVT